MTLRGALTAGAALALSAVLGATSAQAATFAFSFDSTLGDASGTLTATPEGGGAFLVTSLTGDFGGDAISLIAPGGFAGNDNQLFAANPALDFAGVSFAAGGTNYNVYYDTGVYVGPGYAICSQCSGGNETALTNVSISAVPEPAEWGVMLLGFGAIGASIRSRRTKAAVAA